MDTGGESLLAAGGFEEFFQKITETVFINKCDVVSELRGIVHERQSIACRQRGEDVSSVHRRRERA